MVFGWAPCCVQVEAALEIAPHLPCERVSVHIPAGAFESELTLAEHVPRAGASALSGHAWSGLDAEHDCCTACSAWW